ncbi:hypothetical protein MMC29_004220 [Sticta canariensis]|nr:hypothetical protein [Sticta canariensis]
MDPRDDEMAYVQNEIWYLILDQSLLAHLEDKESIYVQTIRNKIETYTEESIAETAIELKLLVNLIRSAQKLEYLGLTFSAYQYSALSSVTDLSADGDIGTR